MHRNRKTLNVLVTATAALCLFQNVAVAKDRKILIAVSMAKQREQRWAVDRAAMEAEASKQGVDITFQYANDDPSKQVSQVENLLGLKPDALILNPVNAAAAGPIIESAHEAGVPVVAYDALPKVKVDAYITRDNYQVGVLQAREALKFAPSGNYAFVQGDLSWEGTLVVRKGYKDELAGKSQIKVVFDQVIAGWSPSTAQSSAENALSANDDKINAFVVMNDGMATGVVQALKSRQLEGKVYVSGLDAETASLKLIASGAQTMSVYTDIVEYGTSGVKAAVSLAKKEVPAHDTMMNAGGGDVPTRLVPIVAVTKSNMCEVIKSMPKIWTTVEQVFGNPDACK